MTITAEANSARITKMISEARSDVRAGVWTDAEAMNWLGRVIEAGLSFMPAEAQQAFLTLFEDDGVPAWA